MSIFKIEQDFENVYLFHLSIAEAAKKMPAFKPRRVAVSLCNDWVAPAGSFYRGDNYKREEAVIPDIALWGLGYLVLSEKTYGRLGGVMLKSGELLPLEIENLRYYFFNCTYILPDEAVEKSKAIESTDVGTPVRSENIAINEWLLGSRSIFRTTFDNKVSLYCTGDFQRLVKTHELSGLDFSQA